MSVWRWRPTALHDFAAPRIDLGVELVVGHNLVDEAHRRRLLRGIAAAHVPDFARFLLADDTRQISGAEARINRTNLWTDLAELRALSRDC